MLHLNLYPHFFHFLLLLLILMFRGICTLDFDLDTFFFGTMVATLCSGFRSTTTAEQVYFEIIKRKTASLIASCCAVGVSSAKNDAETIEKARLFGEKVGMAFQIKDDLFDYGTDEIGKPLGIDIKEKKMTLPLIYALNKADWWTKRSIIRKVKYESENPKKVTEVIEFVKKSGGLEYATNVMKKFQQEAMDLLHEYPESSYRNAMQGLVEYTIERKK